MYNDEIIFERNYSKKLLEKIIFSELASRLLNLNISRNLIF